MVHKLIWWVMWLVTIEPSVGGVGGDSPWKFNGSAMYYNGGKVGIGTNSPDAPLDVETSKSGSAIVGNSTAASGLGIGVTGSIASDAGYGVFGVTS